MKKPSIERIRELLSYDPETGLFTRKVKTVSWNATADSKYGTVGAGRLNEFGYVMISVDSHRYNAGALAWAYTHGVWPERIRYANGVCTDVRLVNIISVDKEKTKNSVLTQERLKQVLHYSLKTGEFTWLTNRLVHVIGKRAGNSEDFGYRSIGIDYKRYAEHNLVWLYMKGEWPNGQIDHINRKRSDNRWENLRCVSRSENNLNKVLFYGNKSGYVGVSLSRKNHYNSYVHVEGTCINLGRYPTIAEARVARLLGEISEHHRAISFSEERDTELPAGNGKTIRIECAPVDWRGEQHHCLIAYNHHGVPFHVKGVATITGIIAAMSEDSDEPDNVIPLKKA